MTTPKVVPFKKTPAKAPVKLSPDAAKRAFVEWLKAKDPALYEMALRRVARAQKLNGFLDIFTSVVSTVKDVAPKVVEMRNQSKILKAQIKAAQAGQPPLSIPYTPIVNPDTPQGQAVIASGVNYGVTPGASAFNRNWLLMGIPVLLVAFFLLRRKRG